MLLLLYPLRCVNMCSFGELSVLALFGQGKEAARRCELQVLPARALLQEQPEPAPAPAPPGGEPRHLQGRAGARRGHVQGHALVR